ATTVAPTSKRCSTSIAIRRSRLASGSPPKNGVATRNALRSGELTAISLIYSRPRSLTAPTPSRTARLSSEKDGYGDGRHPSAHGDVERDLIAGAGIGCRCSLVLSPQVLE